MIVMNNAKILDAIAELNSKEAQRAVKSAQTILE